MKSSSFALAFIVSTAIHAGVLSSNLIPFNGPPPPQSGTRTVRLHIVPAVIRAPASVLPDAPNENPPRKETSQAPSPDLIESRAEPAPTVRKSSSVPHQKDIISAKKPYAGPRVQEEVTALRPVKKENAPPQPPVLAAPPPISPHPEMKPSRTPERGIFHAVGELAETKPNPSAVLAPPLRKIQPDLRGGSLSPARITDLSEPKYPRYSRMHGEEGSTVLSVEIFADGKLGGIEILQTSGSWRLDEAAVKAVKKAQFKPARRDGRAVMSTKQITFRFRLEDSED